MADLISQGASVGTHFAGGGVDPFLAVHAVLDALVAAEAAVGLADAPADVGERLAGRRRHSVLQPKQTGRAETRRILAHALRRALVVPAGGIARGLDVEA